MASRHTLRQIRKHEGMNTIYERPGESLERVVNEALDKLLEAYVTSSPRDGIRALASMAAAYDRAAGQLQAIRQDAELSAEGKVTRGLTVFTAAKAAYSAARASVTAALERDRRGHEDRSAWPRTAGSIADREALMSNARQDLKDLLGNVEAGKRAERLAFAVRNGSDAVRELVLADKYAERVLWPSLPDGSLDAVAWDALKLDLLEEMHPGGPVVAQSLQALRALDSYGVKIEQVMRGIQEVDLSHLIEQGGLGAEAAPGDTPTGGAGAEADEQGH